MSKKLGTIRALRVYQSVTFDKRNETHFSIYTVAGRKPVEINLVEGYDVVEIKSETDHVLVPYANISGIYMLTEKDIKKQEEIKEEKKRASKTSVRASEIKRPI